MQRLVLDHVEVRLIWQLSASSRLLLDYRNVSALTAMCHSRHEFRRHFKAFFVEVFLEMCLAEMTQ